MTINIDQTLASEMTGSDKAQKIDLLFRYMEDKGQSYYDEAVTQLQHALQCALQAKKDCASNSLVTSALLHDLGHFLTDEHDENHNFLKEDFEHEEVGAAYLKPFFDEVVLTPIRLHVPAKRYLCTVDRLYYEKLSDASKRSFQLQGGFMEPEEKSMFESIPYYECAVKLRIWDDKAKTKGQETLSLKSYRFAVAGSLK